MLYAEPACRRRRIRSKIPRTGRHGGGSRQRRNGCRDWSFSTIRPDFRESVQNIISITVEYRNNIPIVSGEKWTENWLVVSMTASQPASQPTNQPASQPATQPPPASGKPAHPATQPGRQPPRQPPSPPAIQPARQPASHPATPASQPAQRASHAPSKLVSGITAAMASRATALKPARYCLPLPSHSVRGMWASCAGGYAGHYT